jgi:flagellar hook-length control protein FliK
LSTDRVGTQTETTSAPAATATPLSGDDPGTTTGAGSPIAQVTPDAAAQAAVVASLNGGPGVGANSSAAPTAGTLARSVARPTRAAGSTTAQNSTSSAAPNPAIATNGTDAANGPTPDANAPAARWMPGTILPSSEDTPVALLPAGAASSADLAGPTTAAPQISEAPWAAVEAAHTNNLPDAPTPLAARATSTISLFGNALQQVAGQADSAIAKPLTATAPPASGATTSTAEPSWMSLATGLPGLTQNASSGNASFVIGTPVGDPGFGQELARGMVYLARSGSQSAELTLNPADLGPVRVELQMNGQQASLMISASHEATRSAMQEALPQLHALFEQNGLQLSGAQVGDRWQNGTSGDPGQRGADSNATAGSLLAGQETRASSAPAGIPMSAPRRVGLVDTFA